MGRPLSLSHIIYKSLKVYVTVSLPKDREGMQGKYRPINSLR